MNTYSTTRGSGATDWFTRVIRDNPEGLLLLAAGCALLFRERSAGGHQRSPQSFSSGEGTGGAYAAHRGGAGRDWEMPSRVSQSAGQARDYAADVSSKVSETAKNYASAAGEYADDARKAIMEHSGRLAEQVQSTFSRVVREQPVAVAVAGLAAGAMVASAFPATGTEREALGSAGKRLAQAASAAGERLTEAASAAGERLVSVAQERGVSAGGLKEAAREVADTFQKSLSADQQNNPASTTRRETPGRTPGTGESAHQPGSASSFGSKPPQGR